MLFLALTLAMASVDASAQKISLGSCITRDGGQFKGEMVSGKPQGKGTTIYKNGDTYEGSYMKVSAKVMAFIPSVMAKV